MEGVRAGLACVALYLVGELWWWRCKIFFLPLVERSRGIGGFVLSRGIVGYDHMKRGWEEDCGCGRKDVGSFCWGDLGVGF